MNDIQATDYVLQILRLVIEHGAAAVPNTNKAQMKALCKSIHHTRLLLHTMYRKQNEQQTAQRNINSGIRLLSSVAL